MMKNIGQRAFLLICFTLIYTISFCQKLTVLPLEDAYKKQEVITTKEFIESFTYIPLETTPECLIDANPIINISGKFIIVTNIYKCLLFDKATGKFICEIGHYGNDPGGYKSTGGYFFNSSTSIFYLRGWKNNLMKYSIEGKEIGSVPIPFESGFTSTAIPEKFDYPDNKLIACNIFNTNGIQNKLVVTFDEKGVVVKTIPNRNITAEHKFSLIVGSFYFAHYGNKLLYNEYFNDTVFSISTEKVQPYLVIKKGQLRPTLESIWTKAEQIRTRDYFESENFISFNFSGKNQYFALYDKSTSKLKVCEVNPGIENDTDCFVPFSPKAIFQEELAGLIQVTAIAGWFEKNKEISGKLPEKLKLLGLKDVTDNPVIVIAKLK